MIKVSIEPPKERIVTIQMTDGEAKILQGFLGKLTNDKIDKIWGYSPVESEKIFGTSLDLYNKLEENL